MKFFAGRWQGNQWASIEIEPVDEAYFLPILSYLMATYDFPKPRILQDVDGYVADFVMVGSDAIIKVDTWSFSIAFAEDSVRDAVLEVLRELPANYFDT